MSDEMARREIVVDDAWTGLRRFTDARIALGRVGDSLPTRQLLAFGLAQAQARDAVQAPLARESLLAEFAAAAFAPIAVHSAASDRGVFLRRPDLGRRLDAASRERLAGRVPAVSPEVVFVVADGLSAPAVAAHALPLLLELRARLPGWRIGPVVVAEQARVALADEIGEILAAAQVVILIGERPGLSSPDSLGAYLTFAPRPGRCDAERNCVSNIRSAGLAYADAAGRLAWLLAAARRLGASGVGLKDESAQATPPLPGGAPGRLANPDDI